jgi:hypothetical protein
MQLTKNLLLTAVFSLYAAAAGAETLTFDDANGLLGNGYHGLDWNNFYVFDGTSNPPQSGYHNGVVSVPNVAYNGYAAPATISKASSFSLVSGEFAGAWNDGLQVHVTGTGATNYSMDFTVNTTGSSHIDFNWTGLTSVTFTSSGGVHAADGGAGEHFALDNLVINSVPEPETYAMLMAGLGIMGFAARRRGRASTAA